MADPAGAWMLIGRVASPFGVRGELKVELHTDFPDRFKGLARVFLGHEHREVEVERVLRHGGQVLLKLRGIDSPEAVRALERPNIFVPRAEAAPLPEGHFYLDDVIGLPVVTVGGRALGDISDVLETGSNEVFVIGRGRDEILIPVIKDAVLEVDLGGRKVIVEDWVLDVEE